MELSGKKVTVVGLGESGLAAARLCCERGAQVTVNDARSEAELQERAGRARAVGAALWLGGHDAAQLSGQDLVVVSPGVPPLAQLDAAERAGVPVVSEIELASRFIEADIVAVTGTNGKSTVTTLLGEMIRESGRRCFVGGNLGTPLVDAVDTEAAAAGGVVVVELSSFQLERVQRFRAHVALLLNVSDDHLDRYPSFEAYVAAKARIFERQTSVDFACVPAGDTRLEALAARSEATVRRFGPGGDVEVRDGRLVDSLRSLKFPVSSLCLPGLHNQLNAAAAVLAAGALELPEAAIERALSGFGGLPHRMQWVAEVAGVRFYDDSKATNVGAAVAAVRGLGAEPGKLVLIAGGTDKGGSYAPLADALEGVARGVVLIGQAAPLIEPALASVPGLSLTRASDMRDAVQRAAALARPGDAVLLAPACSSFDMFRSYAHRGEVFQAAVREHAKEGP